MKILKLLFAVLLLATIGISCSSDSTNDVNNGDDNDNNTSSLFEVKFDGEVHTATSTVATISDGFIGLKGNFGPNGEAVEMKLTHVVPGVYSTAIMTYYPSGGQFSYTNNGYFNYPASVKITSVDSVNHTISGTFSFVAYNTDPDELQVSKSFSDGIFSHIPYTEEENVFRHSVSAIIDGQYFHTDYTGVSIQIREFDDDILTLTAERDGKGIIINLDLQNDEIVPGTYELNFGTPGAYIQSTELNYFQTGSLTILSNSNGRLKGTFDFTAQQSHVCTEGIFDVDSSHLQF